MKKELVLQSVENSVSSIFSKEDVINLINSVDGGGRKITTNDIQRAIDQTIDWLENNSSQIVNCDNAEFEIEWGNRILCTEVPINFDEIREALEYNFMDFGEAEQEEQEVVGSEFVPVEDNEL